MSIARQVIFCAVLIGACNTVALGQIAPRYQAVDQTVADRNSLSTSLRHMQQSLSHPTGFTDVFHVPGEPGKFMRVHGGLQAVFPKSLYGFNQDNQLEAFVPPNTVFRIGPRVVAGGSTLSLLDGHPGLFLYESRSQMDDVNPHRVQPEGFGRAAVLPREMPRQVVASRLANPTELTLSRQEPNEATPAEISQPGTIIGDEEYRRERLHQLLQRAIDAE